MRKLLLSLTVLAASMATATAARAPDAPRRANDFCYMECQYRCYAQHPGGGSGWTACYLACAQANCQSS